MTEAIDPKEIVARRVAREIRPGMLVNLGIGLPSLVANYLPPDAGVFFQAENGVIGLGARPPEGMEEVNLTDAGGGFVTAVPGAASIDSAMSFGLIRGGHLDMTVLGGLQVDERGYLANWTVPGKMVPGMGGAMDLVAGAKRVVVAMIHAAKGQPKIVPECTLPLTARRRVTLIVTELAVIEPTEDGLVLRERGPGTSIDEIRAATSARLIIEGDVAEMRLDPWNGAREEPPVASVNRRVKESQMSDVLNEAPKAVSKYDQLIAAAREVEPPRTVVVHPCDETSLRGAVEAAEAGLIEPVLVGPTAKIRAVATQHRIDLDGCEIVDAAHSHDAAARAVALVREGKGELLMKGSLHTDELMKEVTASATGLRTERRISHVFIMDVPGHPETLFITDAAINIFPDLDAKRDIVQNAIDLWTGIGLGMPRVAILSAVETVTTKIPSTIEAAALCKMAERGQITGALVEGPLAFDNAIDPAAAKIKGIGGPVAGHAQILVVPDLEAGNMLAKNLTFLAHADAAGIVLGARVPIILTSRADSVRTRLASSAVAAIYASARRSTTAVPA